MKTKLKISDLWIGAKVKTSNGDEGVVCGLDDSDCPVRVDLLNEFSDWCSLENIQLISKPRFLPTEPRKMTKDELTFWADSIDATLFCRLDDMVENITYQNSYSSYGVVIKNKFIPIPYITDDGGYVDVDGNEWGTK